jgi:hypothetical protein
MNLLEIRTQFIKISGRYDLISSVEDYTNNGADFYIQSGQDMLDRMANFRHSPKKVFKTLAVDGWYAVYNKCRAVKRVWISKSDSKYELAKRDLHELKNYYGKPASEIDSGNPLYYSPCVTLQGPGADETEMTIDSFGGSATTDSSSPYDNNAILILPPTDTELEVEIHGLFYSNTLSENTDQSVWSVLFPMVLIWAALYQLEVSYRNTRGAEDWLLAITRELTNIDKDGVEEEIAGVNQIEG